MARKLTEAEKAGIRKLWTAGLPVRLIGRETGRPFSTVRGYVKVLARPGVPVRTRSPLRLSLAEREGISRGLAAGESLRAIAAGLGRAPSTISREVRANGARSCYRAVVADEAAWRGPRPELRYTPTDGRPLVRWAWRGGQPPRY